MMFSHRIYNSMLVLWNAKIAAIISQAKIIPPQVLWWFKHWDTKINTLKCFYYDEYQIFIGNYSSCLALSNVICTKRSTAQFKLLQFKIK